MSDSISNEFLTDASLGANTDWIVTLPTKRFYVDAERYPRAPADPFVEIFHAPGESRFTIVVVAYDREERESAQRTEGCGFLCPGFTPPDFPYEVNTFGFLADGTPQGAPSGVVGSRLSVFYQNPAAGLPRGDAGWVVMDLSSGDGGHILPGGTLSTGQNVSISGLPVVGFMVYNVVNANAQPGVLGNYGGVFAHRGALTCHDIAGLPCPTVVN